LCLKYAAHTKGVFEEIVDIEAPYQELINKNFSKLSRPSCGSLKTHYFQLQIVKPECMGMHNET